MKILGLDVGTKTIGVAVSDELGWTAQGVETIKREENDLDEAVERLEELIAEHHIAKIVVGLPKNMNGTIGPSGEACQQFAKELSQRTGLKVEMWDERLSTVAAERMLVSADVSRKKRKKVIDKMAAVMILQGYLDRQN
ncbi:Holliday junction resolvase RuvX [Salipaludibacillus agaradhaerens]|uniref:Putative pre-16S rRNA nuclease n=1 Tax=Salipaludibacillus agaradhaerens TaxID=76935 RepID=A0A9Q4FZP3_SALAG|nr:Holliday junction resolvase RuvX [Salipaludibacillus agaradhaerens]MCR6096949.1 Holliday junction resolvase RuvX [Salipaludibacillus agaradhaerens]MCR6113566.1 Holliday junction resolvase RuvX [Salipaludibacillus agaradhaerens]